MLTSIQSFRPHSLSKFALKGVIVWAVCLMGVLPPLKNLRAESLQRSILAIYDEENEMYLIHRSFEVVCNYYGLKIEYLSSEDPYPQDLSSYRAILTWAVDADFYNAEKLHRFLENAQAQKIKLLFIDQLPAYIERKSGSPITEKYAAFLKRLGLNIGRFNLMNPLFMKVEKLKPELLDFEQQFTFKGIVLPNIESISTDNSVALRVIEKQSRELRADLVVTGPWGGYALSPAVYQGKEKSPLRRWILNPFLFLREALEIKNMPIPDVTTWNGSRAIYCHIDGDAFNGICRFDKKRLCAEVIFEDVLERYQFPHTLSLVNIWLDPDIKSVLQDTIVEAKIESTSKIFITERDRERWIKIAQKMFAPGWVEAGIHGYGHPLKWVERELALRAPEHKFSLDDEFYLSQKIFSQILAGRQSYLFQWTGDCVPNEAAMAKCAESGLLNINGGDSIFDQTYDSYMHVAPLYRQVGAYIQIHSSAANENIYTNGWQGPFYGFRNVIETFKRTESPRRISPVNVYYHFYSGEMMASVTALQDVFDWASQQDLTPIRTTDYVKSVQGFISCTIESIGDGWKIENYGGLRTLRFESELRSPDMKLSKGLLGFHRQDELLYVHLESGDSAEIHWGQEPLQTYLDRATCMVNSWSLTNQELNVEIWGYRPAVIDFKNLKHHIKSKNDIVVTESGNLTRLTIKPQGILNIKLPLEAN